MLEQLWLGIGMAAVGWLFYDGMRVREAALLAGRDYCSKLGLQMLDETVSRQRTGFARGAGGQLALRRHFGFEFTSDGERRYRGDIIMLGLCVESVQVELHRMLH